MKINYKKVVAALTAITSMATLGVGTISASAADLDAINEKILNDTATDEKKVIASCTDSNEIKAIEYLIDNDTSIEDLQIAKQVYDEALTSNTASYTEPDFYSSYSLAETRHSVVLVDTAPNVAKDESISADFDKSVITSTLNLSFYHPYSNTSYFSVADITCDNYGFTLLLRGSGYRVSSPKMIDIENLNYSESGLKKKASTKNKKVSEQLLYDSLGIKMRKSSGTLEIQTYARADVYRDGIINADDSLAILQYLDGTNDLLYTYSDGKTHGSSIVNLLAADVNLDGQVTKDDVILLNKYLVGSATIS